MPRKPLDEFSDPAGAYNPFEEPDEGTLSGLARRAAQLRPPLQIMPEQPPIASPLTERQFYRYYSQHIDVRGRREGTAENNLKSILETGFKPGFNVNTLPPYRGGPPQNVVDQQYAPKSGDVVYLVPNHSTRKTGNGQVINENWKPQPYEALRITEDYPSLYQEYLKAFNAFKSR